MPSRAYSGKAPIHYLFDLLRKDRASQYHRYRDHREAGADTVEHPMNREKDVGRDENNALEQ